MSELVVRRATAADIRAYAPDNPAPTMIAYVGDLDGEIIAIGGLAFFMGRWIAFCDLTDKARPYKYRIARGAVRVFAEARKRGIRYIYADADMNEETSLKWLKHLGFQVDPKTGVLMRWENTCRD